MKDHEIRGVVNELTEVANRYANTQQLRDRMSSVIVPVLKNRLPRPQTNREAFEAYVKRKYNTSYVDMFAKENDKYLKSVWCCSAWGNVYTPVQHLWEVWNHG